MLAHLTQAVFLDRDRSARTTNVEACRQGFVFSTEKDSCGKKDCLGGLPTQIEGFVDSAAQ